ncbi:MAG: DNA repair protein RecO [Oscillospiraceae bacterium]|nr:DNA repair protein RecO [Oscillospiraceae bacterium]
MHIQTEALVLREALYKEADKILTVLTRDEGKRTVRARGARRVKNKLAAASQPLVYSRMTLFTHKDRTTLDEAEVLDVFFALRQDVQCLSLAMYLAQLCEALSDEAPDPAIFSLMLNTCHALSHLQKPPSMVKPAVELRLLSLCGYQPSVGACPVCGKLPPVDPCLHMHQGLAHCAACRGGLEDGISLPLGLDAWMALRHIVLGDAKRLFAFRLDPEPLSLLAAASETFALTHLDRGFRTLDFYHRLDCKARRRDARGRVPYNAP